MSINKKLLIFVIVLVVVPMLLLFLISTLVLDKQIEKSAQSYLENALKIARNRMIGRLEEMKKGCQTFTQSPEFRKSVKEKNLLSLGQELGELKTVYDYLDFIIVLDANKDPLVSLPATKKQNLEVLQGLMEQVGQNKEALSSETMFDLNDLFPPDSEEYNKFKVKIARNGQGGSEEQQYLTKCLAGVAVAPIYWDDHKERLSGFLLVGDIVNNDQYFPKTYSLSVKDSYLAISIQGVRVTSNIRSPKKENFIGSRIPIPLESLEGLKNSYFGRVNMDDEIHVFLDEPISDHEGRIVGVLGVGIPEEKFSVLINTNRNLIFVVTFLCLCIMLVIGRRISLRITRPIIEATRFAEAIVRGERDLIIKEELLEDGRSETTILLKTFQKMARDLKESEEERKRFLDKLKEEHDQQQKLAEQLQVMNDELEEKVEARTQDLRQAIIALKKADEVKSQFLANMSHELRTPLNAIISASEILRDKIFGSLNEKQEKYIQNIWNSGVHLLQLINDILDLSKIEAGKMTLSLSHFYIAEIVANSFQVVKTLAYRKNIEVSTQIFPGDFMIKADGKKLKQILYNLLSNAIKFTPEGGKVEVEVYKRGEFMQVMIRDNGIGIKEEDQERVFREFEQVDSSYERQHEGTGLGLPLTKKLVEMHGGEIYLTSKPDQGTEVIFTIPIDTESFLASRANVVAKRDGNGKGLNC
ncbi:HAMP domain-containing protein [Thermanaerosceptrum fracticalcis]|uniref:Circadian input-output histidine kinase CikA n=1 Tax=Thermanaerosceptrum fracticalcis TaxID=1712410 RepID=A0A7G6E268_THEFR|nr:ATP-binding protein [Thermanaerosceptrum fracticalcis]QNB46172.1 HAMP domain-containing protein [Thermanaerosceptrum fracticalcis]